MKLGAKTYYYVTTYLGLYQACPNYAPDFTYYSILLFLSDYLLFQGHMTHYSFHKSIIPTLLIPKTTIIHDNIIH